MSFTVHNKTPLDVSDWKQLRGTSSAENMIQNRVSMEFRDNKTLIAVSDLAEKINTSLIYIKYPSDMQAIYYFNNPVDRSRFLNELTKNCPASATD